MLTIFTCPKPFHSHIATIQYNAIKSWTLLEPKPQIIIFGLEPGTAEISQELNLQHVPEIAKNQQGTPLISDIFQQGQALADYPLAAYLNADILLLDDFVPAVIKVAKSKKRFLMVGQRCNLDVGERLSFAGGWQNALAHRARSEGKMFGPIGIDYFVFPRGILKSIPPFAVGRAGWDNWMIFNFRSRRIPVIDATERVLAVHQNHDYSHHPEGWDGAYKGVEAKQNIELAGGRPHIFTLEDATHALTANGFRRIRRKLDTRANLKRLGVLYPGLSVFSRFLVRVYDFLNRRVGIANR